MRSNEDYSKKIELFKKKGSNTKCFECNQKGTTYVCISFGTFVCSECAGILSNLRYKVKGLGVASFNKNEYEFIMKNGNDKAKLKWLSNFNPNKDKYPNHKNYDDVRKFIINKYQFKKYCNQDGNDNNLNNNIINNNINQQPNFEVKNPNNNFNKKENIENNFMFDNGNKVNNTKNNNDINDIFDYKS